MRTTARVAAALLTTTIVVGGTATSAFAQSTTLKDKASDVVSYGNVDDENDPGAVLGYADSIATGADARSLKVNHGKKKVTVTVKFADLKSGTAVSVVFRPQGKKQPNRVFVNTGRKSGEVYDMKDKTICAVPVKTKLGKGGSVKATIKRSCLGNPKKFRVSAVAVRFTDGGGLYVDPISPRSIDIPTETKSLKAS